MLVTHVSTLPFASVFTLFPVHLDSASLCSKDAFSLASCACGPLLHLVKEDLGVPIIKCSCTSPRLVNVGIVALLPCENGTHSKVPDGCGFENKIIFCDILT